MVDHGVVFLTRSRQEARHVHEAHDGDIEAVAEAHEASSLARGVAVEYAGVNAGLVGHNANALAVEAGETDDNVARKGTLHFEELTIVHHSRDNLIHIVGHVGVVGDNLVEAIFLAVDGVVAGNARGAFHVVLRQIGEQAADKGCKLFFRLGREVANATLRGVNACAAEIFLRYVLARHGFHHLRTGEEHVAHAFEHHHEVGEGRRINRSAGARAADAGYLRHYAAGLDVALEDVAKTGEGVDAFLYACAA